MEESLDAERRTSAAPMANIILFEASDTGQGLYTAIQTAADTAGVVAISMSWSEAESDILISGMSHTQSEEAYDSTYFVTPGGHVGGSATLGGTGDSRRRYVSRRQRATSALTHL